MVVIQEAEVEASPELHGRESNRLLVVDGCADLVLQRLRGTLNGHRARHAQGELAGCRVCVICIVIVAIKMKD